MQGESPLRLSLTQQPITRMKKLFTLLAILALGVQTASAEDTPLGKAMSGMNKSMRALKKQVADPSKKAESLELVGKIKASIDDCKKLEPAWTEKVPAGEKAAFLAKYKEQMDGVAESFATIETALKADKFDDAKAVFEKLSEQKEKGHKDFHADDDK
jgi:hypothetical protein